MADVYDDMPPLVARPLAPPLPPDEDGDDVPPLVERPVIVADSALPPLVVNPKLQSRWETITDEPLKPASGPVRTGKDTASSGPPKPPNAFILFRASFVKANLVPREAERDHATLSKIIGIVWRGLDSEEKVKWQKKAGEAREEWRAKNPDWRFSKAGYSGGGTGKNGGGGGRRDGTKTKETRKKKKGSQKERVEAIAGLIAQGVKDGALADAIQSWDVTSSPSPPPVEAPRKKPKTRARMAPYVRMLSFDEEVKLEPVDSPRKPVSPLPTVHREPPAPVSQAHTAHGDGDTYGDNASVCTEVQYQHMQDYHFDSFSVTSSPVTPALMVESGSPPPADNTYVPSSPALNGFSASAAVNYDTGGTPTPDAGSYSPADAYYTDRRSSYASTFSGQDTPVTPNFFGQDPAVYNGGYESQHTIASNYAFGAISPPGSPTVFALPNSVLDHHSSYSTLSGWNGAPALTDANIPPQAPVMPESNAYYGVSNVKPAIDQALAQAQPQAYDAKAYGGVFSAKNVDATAYSTKNVVPAVYNVGDPKHPAFPVYQAAYTTGGHAWGPSVAWVHQVGYA